MGDGRRNVELGATKLVGKRTAKLPVKRRFQVSLRMSGPRHRLRMPVNASSEEGDNVEILPYHCGVKELSSGSDTEASDGDEENEASGYLADSEMEPRRQRVSRTRPCTKLKAGIGYC